MHRLRREQTCGGCHHGMSRRHFIKGAGAALAAAGGLSSAAALAGESEKRPVRVALVFLSTKGSSWPYPEYDNETREKEILGLLKKGCPGIELTPVLIRQPDDVQKAAGLKENVDGYLVYCLTLNWSLLGAVSTIGKLGKPMVLADEFLGGSGVFLLGYTALGHQGIPVCGIATRRESDLVAVAGMFADLKPGATPESFAGRCQKAYRKTFPTLGELRCLDDRISLPDIGKCVERFRKSRFLIVGRDGSGREQDFLGAKGVYVGFDELKALYDKVDPDKAAEWAERWMKEADRVVEPTSEWIRKAAAVYLATLELLRRYDSDTVTMNCLGGFAAGQLPAYPCLGFMQLLNDGGHGICEAMPDDTLSILMGRILTGRPGYVSDPVLDTSRNQIVYAHCVATTKAFGTGSKPNMFRIRTLHDHDPRGTCAQSFLPEGYMTTSFQTDFARKQMAIHQAKAVGNLDSDRGCRTQLVGEVKGDIEKLFRYWDHWHRVTVYGDVKEPLAAFAGGLGLKVIEEA